MQTHLPSRLSGPITHRREWWMLPADHTDTVPNPTDPGIRTALVRRIRREIAAGTYDTPEKMEQALQRLLHSWEE